MTRVYNFSAGPAMLPVEILEQAQRELLDWGNMGASVMEVGHRSKPFAAMMKESEQKLRSLLAIPENYHVLFLAGPARAQFANVPLNLLGDGDSADYILTGMWSEMAAKEAKRYCQVNVVANNQADGYRTIPVLSEWQLNPNVAYVHYTANETVHGIEFAEIPDVGEVPLVVDMTSSLLSQPIAVDRFGVIYAGAQKNIAPAGLTLVIIRDDLLNKALPHTPTVCNYTVQHEKSSLYHTPASFNCYMAGLMFQWLERQGGLEVMHRNSQTKSKLMYNYIDKSDFYYNRVAPECRSRLNVPFNLMEPTLDDMFIQEAQQAGLIGLKGHRSLGGMRASMYNSMSKQGVQALIDFMQDFVRRRA